MVRNMSEEKEIVETVNQMEHVERDTRDCLGHVSLRIVAVGRRSD